MQEKIERFALRDIVHRKLLERIVRGQLPPGSRVKDTGLSAELQVSRTPVREALLRLVKEGFLENLVGRGFMVRPLTGREVEEIYPIIWRLETLALKKIKKLSAQRISQLKTINREMSQLQSDFISLIELDQQWHNVLLSGCTNQRLMSMIEDLKSIAFRYEYAFMQDMDLVKTSMEEHNAVLVAITQKGINAAEPLLEAHWEFTMKTLLKKLQN
jgi:DNA-binding GntR family transcriptional regulator